MATLTIKNLPEELHKRLKENAAQHRRSINSEILALLEEGLHPRRRTADEILASARVVRENMKNVWLDDRKIDQAKREGRR